MPALRLRNATMPARYRPLSRPQVYRAALRDRSVPARCAVPDASGPVLWPGLRSSFCPSQRRAEADRGWCRRPARRQPRMHTLGPWRRTRWYGAWQGASLSSRCRSPALWSSRPGRLRARYVLRPHRGARSAAEERKSRTHARALGSGGRWPRGPRGRLRRCGSLVVYRGVAYANRAQRRRLCPGQPIGKRSDAPELLVRFLRLRLRLRSTIRSY